MSLLLNACNKPSASGDPKIITIEAAGSWQSTTNDSIVMAIDIIENEDSNRVLICDQTFKGNGCTWGHYNNDNTILFDNPNLPELTVENPSFHELKLSTANGASNSLTGTYSYTDWTEGTCGFFSRPGNKIGVVSGNCIIGNWYTLVPDPFGGQNQIIYKNYNYDGTGELILPNDDKTIGFDWKISGEPDNTLLYEYQFSDTTYSDVSYAFDCNATGLALGVDGKSWIRINKVCF